MLISTVLCSESSDRKLEGIDCLFRKNKSILVFHDEDAIGSQRPQAYVKYGQTEVRRYSSVVSGNYEAPRQRFKKLSMAKSGDIG